LTPTLLEAGAPDLAPSSELGDVVRLLDALAATAGTDAAQLATGAQMRRFAADHPDALTRSCLAGHFTGSACVIDPIGGRTLLLFHRKLQRWLQPGGHADGDANLAGVALKEATEETGIVGLAVDPRPIDLDVHAIERPHEPGGPSPHLHLDVRFLVVAPPGARAAGNHESEELRWVTEADAAALGIDDGTRRLLRAAFTRAAG
jgi:8-oxo-dGTP pyrophosphatase MutT (NUDIX family)